MLKQGVKLPMAKNIVEPRGSIQASKWLVAKVYMTNTCLLIDLYGDGKKFTQPVWYSCGKCKKCKRDTTLINSTN